MRWLEVDRGREQPNKVLDHSFGFSRGIVASHGTGRIVEVGEVVSIGGLTVRPGDVLHGDHNGVVSVPEEIAAKVGAAARIVLDTEDAMQRRIHAETLDYESLRRDFTH